MSFVTNFSPAGLFWPLTRTLGSKISCNIGNNLDWIRPVCQIAVLHTEVKYSIAGVEFQAAKQFILSSFGAQLYLSWWSNGLRHQANSWKAVGSIPTWGDFFLNVHFSKNFFFWNFKRLAQAGTWIYLQFFGLWMSAHYISIDSN